MKLDIAFGERSNIFTIFLEIGDQHQIGAAFIWGRCDLVGEARPRRERAKTCTEGDLLIFITLLSRQADEPMLVPRRLDFLKIGIGDSVSDMGAHDFNTEGGREWTEGEGPINGGHRELHE